MSNYSFTHMDMSREVREELYDGTARITMYDPDGEITSETLVPSYEEPPVEALPAEERIAALEAALAAALALLNES